MIRKMMNEMFFDVIVYAMMIIAVIFVLIQTILGNNNSLLYKILLGIWILAAVVVNDFVEPKCKGKFNKMKEYKLQIYMMYAISDAAAYALLYIFVVNVGFFQEVIHYFCLLLALIFFFMRNRFLKKFHLLSDGGKSIVHLEESDFNTQDDVEIDTLDDDEDMKTFIFREK